MSRVVMKKHLSTHYFGNQLQSNSIYKCSMCNFKSEWQYTCKKHILTCHLASGSNATVIKLNGSGSSSEENAEERRKEKPIKITIKPIENLVINHQSNKPNGLNGHKRDLKSEDLEDLADDQDENENDIMKGLNHTVCYEEEEKVRESVLLTHYDGKQFTAHYLVSGSSAFLNGNTSLNGQSSQKKKNILLSNMPI